MPPKGTRAKKGKGKAAPPPEPEPVQPEPEAVQPEPEPEEAEETIPTQKPKRKKTVTSFNEDEKEEIIEFLMRNEVLYSKRLAGYKDVTQKEGLWAAQAAEMNTTMAELKIWYTSMRTMLGRLKKRANKSGTGGDAITDMNGTEKWVWDKFAFLKPHIETLDARNVASFAAAAASASGTELTPSISQTSVVASTCTSSRAPTPPLPAVSPPASHTSSQPGSVGSIRGSEDRMNSGELKDLLVEFMSRSTASSGSSYFGKYVEETLSKLPGELRMDAEANIMQELHRAQRAAEHSHMQPPPRQDQQAPFQFQQQSQQFQQQPQQFQQQVPQFQHSLWQPNPSQWPPRPVGHQTSVWGSQDRSYVQRQVPTHPMTSPLPPTSETQPGPSSGVRATSTTTALPSSLDDSFVSLLGASTPAAGSFNLSSKLNTPRPLSDEDDDDTELA